MPIDMYETKERFVFWKEKIHFPKIGFKGVGRIVGTVVVTLLTALVAAVTAGVLLALGGNATLANFTISFDPQITVAYLLVFFFVSRFSNLSHKQGYNFFLLALMLSFTVNFIQGSIMLVLLPLVLIKFHLMEDNARA